MFGFQSKLFWSISFFVFVFTFHILWLPQELVSTCERWRTDSFRVTWKHWKEPRLPGRTVINMWHMWHMWPVLDDLPWLVHILAMQNIDTTCPLTVFWGLSVVHKVTVLVAWILISYRLAKLYFWVKCSVCCLDKHPFLSPLLEHVGTSFVVCWIKSDQIECRNFGWLIHSFCKGMIPILYWWTWIPLSWLFRIPIFVS